jgi:hypothetical protein
MRRKSSQLCSDLQKLRNDGREIKTTTAQIVTGTLDREKARPRRDQREGAAQFVDRAERIAGPLDEQRRDAEPGKMIGPQTVRLSRRMQRVREEEQRRNELGLLGGKNRGLPSAIGLAAEEEGARYDAVHRVDCRPKAGAVRCRAGGRGRPGQAALAERQVAAKHNEPSRAECLGRRDQERRAAIPTGAMRQHEAAFRCGVRPVQKAANIPFRKRRDACHSA